MIIVMMENQSLSQVIGSSSAPFINNTLRPQSALALGWGTTLHPSDPNYYQIAYGDTMGVTSDSSGVHPPPPSILDVASKSGRSWAAITHKGTGSYHFAVGQENPLPPTNGGPGIVSASVGDQSPVINAAKAGVNLIWFTPDNSENMHDNGVSGGDTWLSTWIPQLLTSMSPNGVLFILWDEGNDTLVPAIFAGPRAKKGYVSMLPYNHLAFGKLLETLWGALPGGLRNCEGAVAPTEFLT